MSGRMDQVKTIGGWLLTALTGDAGAVRDLGADIVSDAREQHHSRREADPPPAPAMPPGARDPRTKGVPLNPGCDAARAEPARARAARQDPPVLDRHDGARAARAARAARPGGPTPDPERQRLAAIILDGLGKGGGR